MSTPFVPHIDAYGHYARNLLAKYIADSPSPPVSRGATVKPSGPPKDPVGILGAGPGGLYAALILDDLGIPYKILEARDRVGGRLFTHYFENPAGSPYNYFDVGAMRFPQKDAMSRIFHLFSYPPLNTDGIALEKRLVPFLFKGGGNNNTLLSYNDITVKQNAIMTADEFKMSETILDVPASKRDAYLKIGAAKIVDDVIKPFATKLLDDIKKIEQGQDAKDGWNYLLEYDAYSTRAYMAIAYKPSKELKDLGMPDGPLPTDVINWCETFDKSTGWYDRSLAETVLEAIAFGWSPDPKAPPTPWWCIDGGVNKIATDIVQYITKRKGKDIIVLSSPVTSISSLGADQAEVVAGGTTYKFSSVICTIPLPVLRTLDLSNAGLSSMQKSALRDLNYGPSVKIGMQFGSAWWSNGKDKDGNPLNIVGGQTYTDRPLRTTVYPSFGTDVQAGTTTTLIASYCWTEDATRLGALIAHDPEALKTFTLKELAKVHNLDYDTLKQDLIGYFPWSWSLDLNTMGAFAFFGPGKFGDIYKSMNVPAGSGKNILFAGEALSARHAWVEGALDSAWRAVCTLIGARYDDLKETFVEHWGINAEWISKPVVRLPPDAELPAIPRGDSGEPRSPVLIPTADDLFSFDNSLLFQNIAINLA